MTHSKTISKDDNVFATIIAKGKTLKSIVARNFSDLNEVINTITTECHDYCGLAQLNVRNQSQGWALNLLLRINNKRHSRFLPQKQHSQPHDGLQYRLAF